MRTQALMALATLSLLGAACSSDPGFEGAKAPKVETARNADGSIDDRSMCDWKGKEDRETSETAGPGAIQPNVRRVWQIVGTGEDRHRALVCREIDTNFDGVKDVVRKYNDKGESLHEESDSNYDGRIDTWLTFAGGRLAEVRVDSDHDGNPDEWKYYSGGKLARIKRDTNRDGKPDVWEIYRMGRLERMGVDIDADERVDRWDHDNELKRRLEDDERKKEDEAAAAAAKKAAEDQAAADKANEAVDDSGSAAPSSDKKK
ncbi:hypothetical protein [Sorangium sp. So ce381]|uniref:hypothetical protein n=1 Tax=Sorangium sp. So ce381 TaxID=3133307 RepID=UPI003F5C524B